MRYKQIKPKKIYEEVTEALYEMIRTGRLKPGDRLESVQQLAENFNVGRSAIREALTALSAMGLIEIKQGEGTFVKAFEATQLTFPLSTAILMNKEDVLHLLEVRKILETGTAALAAKNRTEDDLIAILTSLNEMKVATGNEELGEKSDFLFHLALANASHNPLLANLLTYVSGLMVETMKETRKLWLFSKQTTIQQLYEEHDHIYSAIKNRDEESAREAMLSHLCNVEKILERYFEETNKNK
ncbi:FadR/GntR family transcriptional regulator [Bacillus sp. 03113]|uniref:FadR/GntR family transcriptional regulator n=1 Tax=Bacillus sp. 03113 TaxID=2578211 RepID=UPI0011414EF1|nr:FadR/GntR family transcriptional regulator [Bacillus sp. 03113]